MNFYACQFILVVLFIKTCCIYGGQQCQGRKFDVANKSLGYLRYYHIQSARSDIECAKHCKRDKNCDQAYYWKAKRQCFLISAKNEKVLELKGDEDLVEMMPTKTVCDTRAITIKGEDCAELFNRGLKQSGTYILTPRDGGERIKVYCDMKTKGGGWTVFQNRKDGSEDFNRGWDDYKNGFGSLTGEFWLGNENLHRLTNQGTYQLRVDMRDKDDVTAYALYEAFSIASEVDKYRLSIGAYSGTAGDSLGYHRGYAFTTKDRDNDAWLNNCALSFKGGWWYRYCSDANLNGLHNPGYSRDIYMNWESFDGHHSLKRVTMKFRPAGFKSK